MIRGVRHYSLAVRRPDGEIFCTTDTVSRPLLRPDASHTLPARMLILAETLWLGMKSLQRSALIAAGEENAEGEQSSGGQWAMVLTMAVALGAGNRHLPGAAPAGGASPGAFRSVPAGEQPD